jgi:alanine-synthesizing transaminase
LGYRGANFIRDSEPYEFYSVRRLPPYVFEQVNRLKASARAAGADIIDLGMGNPDLPTPAHIVAKLAETARRDDTHGYSASRGITGLRRRRRPITAAASA